MKERFLNLGCGDRFDPNWTNIDFNSTSPHVQAHDLMQGLRFSDSHFDLVYLSHVLEHFSRSAGLKLLRECHRVLRSGGIVRVVVPDLEQIAKMYLTELQKVSSGETTDSLAYDWMTLELYDQTTRENFGGEMIELIRTASSEGLEFIRKRIGGELDRIQDCERRRLLSGTKKTREKKASGLRRRLTRLVAGQEWIRAYDVGRFRLSGEMHLWMYDRFSLGRALKEAQFVTPRRVQPTESSIPNWSNFNLDTEPDGRIYKPDSLYMEATRP